MNAKENDNRENNESLAEQFKALDKFLVDNRELEDLSARLSIFNLFKVLRVEQAEIRHNNVLAWLLDPRQSHGLGDVFLRRFLSTLLLDNESIVIALTPAQIELMNIIDIEVWREWKNTDIVVFSRSEKWVLLIENKLRGVASKRQLLKYIEIIKREFPDFVIIPVLLTLEIDEGLEVAEETGFVAWSHAQMYHVASNVVEQRKNRIPHDAKLFLEHYLVSLRRLTMQEDELIQLCKNIYRKHKDAIDLIIELGATSQFEAVAEDFLSDNPRLHQLCLTHRWTWFIPEKWKDWMPPCSNRWKHLSEPYPVACRFVFRTKVSKLGFIIEIGSMEDAEKRLDLVKAFNNEGFKILKKAFSLESRYTRIFSIYRKLDEPSNKDEMRSLADELWKKSKGTVESAGHVIKSFGW